MKANRMTTVPIFVRASPNAMVDPYVVDVVANYSLERPLSSGIIPPLEGFPIVSKPYTIPVTVRAPPPPPQQLVLGPIDPQILASLYALIVVPLVAWLLPRIFEFFNQRRQRRNLRKCITEINGQHDSARQNDEYLHALEGQMRTIEDRYTNGEISESQFNILKDKIAAYKDDASRPPT